MKTEVVKEVPAFVLQGASYNGSGEVVSVSFSDLRDAKVGAKWEGRDNHNCGRALYEERAEIVHKTNNGVAVIFHKWGTSDDMNPTEWESEPVLKWYEFQKGGTQ